MQPITLEQLKELEYHTVSTQESKRLTGIIDLVEFQRGMYGDEVVSQITNGQGHTGLTVQG